MAQAIIVAAVIKKGEKILLGRKHKGKGPYPDTWHIPGGKVEANEKCDEALKREIKEEANLQIKNLKRVAWDEDITDKNGKEIHFIFLQYLCDYASGELEANDDMAHFEWVSIKDLNNYDLNKPTRKLLQTLKWLPE